MRILALFYMLAVYIVVSQIVGEVGGSSTFAMVFGCAFAVMSGAVLFFINGAFDGDKIDQ